MYGTEDQTPGGQGGQMERYPSLDIGVPFLEWKDPAGYNMRVVDSLAGGGVRPTNYFLRYMEGFNNDIRNSEYNIQRTHYYNNPASPAIHQRERTKQILIHLECFFLNTQVLGNISWKGATSAVNRGYTSSDFIVYRLTKLIY